MKFIPKTVFILENGKYTEITYEELQFREQNMEGFKDRKFLPLYGTLMEVTKADYDDFYRVQRRQKYLYERAIAHRDFSYSELDTEEFNGEDILISPEETFDLYIVDKLMIEKLCEVLPRLSPEELEIIDILYKQGVSERELARRRNIPQKTLNNWKRKILEKLKNFLNN